MRFSIRFFDYGHLLSVLGRHVGKSIAVRMRLSGPRARKHTRRPSFSMLARMKQHLRRGLRTSGARQRSTRRAIRRPLKRARTR